MFRLRASQPLRPWVWFAVCIFTLSAWMPALSSWVASWHARASWVQVCSVTGAKWVQANAGSAQPAEGGPAHELQGSAHCPFCLLQDHTPVLPPSLPAQAAVVAHTAVLIPPLLLHAPRPLHAWSPLSARAPPLAV
jgi:hypothetical protein